MPDGRSRLSPTALGPREGERGPVPTWLGVLVEPIYAAAIARRNAGFDAGKNVVKLDVPVISVGNLSVGGTGKTPMVMHIVGVLVRAGVRVCIAMRGYSRSRRAGVHAHVPDETDSYRRAFPDVPIVAQPDRLAGLRELMAAIRPDEPPIGCVVLDDGFQHRRIARDLDIVLVDATRPPTGDRLLPTGWLREPVRNLRRASMVILTHAEQVTPEQLREVERAVQIEHAKPPIAVTRHLWTGLLMQNCVDVAPDHPLPLDMLLGKRVIACCAIGNPGAFVRSLKSVVEGGDAPTGRVLDQIILPDHDPFAPASVRRLIELARDSGAEAIVVTDKDWSKLRRIPPESWPCPVYRPVLEMGFDSGQRELEAALLAAALPRQYSHASAPSPATREPPA